MIQRFHYKELSSTNDYAKELVKSNELIAVTADIQTKGRGRNNKYWEGEAYSNVFLSFGINHNSITAYKYPSRYQSLGAICVYNVLSKYIRKESIRIKFPNDIYIFDETFKKISGILVEHSISGKKADSTIIGIGININQSEFSKEINQNTSSLARIGINLDLDIIINDIINEFEKLLNQSEDFIFNLWIELLNIINKNVLVKLENRVYRIAGVNLDCSLNAVGESQNLRRIDNGDSIIYEL